MNRSMLETKGLSRPEDVRSQRLVRFALAGLIAVVIASNVVFVAMKSAPRGLDELDVFAEGVYYQTARAGFWGIWTMQTDDQIGCPPLLPWVGWIFTEVFGRSYIAMAASVSMLEVVLLLAMYGIGRRLSGATAGLICAAAAATSPIVVGYSRIFTTNLPALAMTAAAMWALLRGERFTRPGSGLLAGVMIGLANLAERGTPPMWMVGPAAFWCLLSIVAARKDREAFKRTLRRVSLAAGVALLISGRYLHFYFFRTADHIAALGMHDVFGNMPSNRADLLPEWMFYPASLFLIQLGAAWSIPFLVGLLFFLRRLSAERLLLVIQMLWPMLIMTPFASKMFDFDMGTLVGAIPITAIGLASIPWKLPRRAAMAACGLVAALSFWIFQPMQLPQPPWPRAVRDWLAYLNNADLLPPDTPVPQDQVHARLAKRIPGPPARLFVYRVEPSGPLDTLVCETANFAWLYMLDSEQYAILDPGVEEGSPIEVELWPLSEEDRRIYRAEYYRPPCAKVSYDPPVAPAQPEHCRPIYADVIEGRGFVWKLCE